MNLQEYKNKEAEIKEAYDTARKKLATVFAFANNPYKPGDKVGDTNGFIVITSVGVGFDKNDSLPKCIYKGDIVDSEGNTTEEEREMNVKREVSILIRPEGRMLLISALKG